MPTEAVGPSVPSALVGSTDQELLTVDYSRLVTVLWGVCKNLQLQCQNLQGRTDQLEQVVLEQTVNSSLSTASSS